MPLGLLRGNESQFPPGARWLFIEDGPCPPQSCHGKTCLQGDGQRSESLVSVAVKTDRGLWVGVAGPTLARFEGLDAGGLQGDYGIGDAWIERGAEFECVHFRDCIDRRQVSTLLETKTTFFSSMTYAAARYWGSRFASLARGTSDAG